MHTSMEGNKFTLNITFTRFKVAVIAIIVLTLFWWPYHLLGKANDKITIFEKNRTNISVKMPSLDIKEPIVSPYALPSESKRILNEWLRYGVHNGHEKLLQKYSEVTKDKDSYKPFLYLIETEWRLGHWESIKIN